MRLKTSLRYVFLFGMLASTFVVLGGCHTRVGDFMHRAVHK